MNDDIEKAIHRFKNSQDNIIYLINEYFHLLPNENPCSIFEEDQTSNVLSKLPRNFSNQLSFYDYIGIKIKIYSFQRLLTELLIKHADIRKGYISVYTHLLGYYEQRYFANEKDPTSQNEYDKAIDSKARTTHVIKDDEKKINNSYIQNFNVMDNYGIFYKSNFDSFDYTMHTSYAIETFLKSDLALLYWHLNQDNRIPDIYSYYLNLLLDFTNARADTSIFSKASDAIKSIKSTRTTNDSFDYFLNNYTHIIDSINNLNFETLKNSFSLQKTDYDTKSSYAKAVYYNYHYLINNVLSTDFFDSITSNFFKDCSNLSNISTIYQNNSLSFYDLQTVHSLNLLELLATFNINTNEIDKYIENLVQTYITCSPNASETIDIFLEETDYDYQFSNKIDLFKKDLHVFLLRSVEYVLEFCQNWFQIIDDLQLSTDEDVYLKFILCIQEILSPYIKTESFSYSIPKKGIEKSEKRKKYNRYKRIFSLNDKKNILYILHYLSIHRDLHSRVTEY